MNNNQAYIRPSSKFYGKFEVVTATTVIPCHNYATASTIVKSLNSKSEVNNGK